jgi:sugar/nucleoside kinase (ribokinase family)
MTPPYDYLIIGHVTRDLVTGGWQVGGTAAFAGQIGLALGLRTAILTSAPEDFPFAEKLPGLVVRNIPSETTTTFSNIYENGHRHQIVHDVAAPLRPEHVPQAWRAIPIVHLAPLVAEVEPGIVDLFPDSLVGVTPQGWMRRWDQSGLVSATRWRNAGPVIARADAVILSEEDYPDEAALEEIRHDARLLVVTQADKGCQIHLRRESRHIPAPAVPVNGPTGAGDTFAAAFLAHLHRSDGDVWAAAEFANEIAAHSVAVVTLAEKRQLVETMIKGVYAR